MLIFNQIYKKFLIQYVLFSLNLYRNLQTPHKNIIFEAPINPLIKATVKSPVMGSVNGLIKVPI